MMATFLSQLNWRNATKKFDPSNKVSDATIEKICEGIRMAPSSFGLQPFYVKVVKNSEVKLKLQEVGWGQVQFPTSTAVFVFVARSNVLGRIDEMMREMSGGDAAARQKLADFEKMLTGFATPLSEADAKIWAQKQCYIALGFGLAACAELGVASCPMEGFSREDFDRVLGLPKGDYSTVVMTVGNASPDFKPFPKFRFPLKDLIRQV
jgi:nitroreductase/dihydropteridine reductase